MASGQTANTAPLLVGGLGLATAVLSSMNAALFSVEAVGVLVPAVLVFGEVVQTIAGVSECRGELATGRGMVPAP
jgi:succinate-acetate transporter protein